MKIITYGSIDVNKPGFWGDVTAMVDWCEENYAHNHYIAEFWNTLSNIFYLFFFIYRYRKIKKKDVAEYMTLFSILGIYIGSSTFHATLKYNTQMLDEIPMIFLAASQLMKSLNLIKIGEKRFTFNSFFIFLYSAILSTVNYVSASYVFLPIIFGCMSYLYLIIMIYITVKLKADRSSLYWGTFIYTLAFIFWLVDCKFCEILRSVRNRLQSPLSVLFQFHGMWHLLTAISGYQYSIHLDKLLLISKYS